MAVSPTRAEARDAFLDAAERLLGEVGWADVTTRRLAKEAGLNHGLVHYYFGSMEDVLVEVLERFTARHSAFTCATRSRSAGRFHAIACSSNQIFW